MKPPAFWNNPQDAPGIAARFLHPLSLLWRAADDRRWRSGAHARVGVPVICVGNINLGGTGKTPTVIWLVERLRDLGVEAHVVSRGHGGRARGPLQVAEGMDPAEVGDEPLLLAAFARVWVAKGRLEGARAAVAAGAEAIVLDDGMQNPAVAKDFTVMVVDARTGFGNGRIVPAGPLRQSVAEGAARADLMLTIGSIADQRRFRARWAVPDTLPRMRGRIEPLQTGMDWSDMRVLAFAGIGRPEKFYETLRGLGAQVVATRAFGDHEPLPDAALQRLAREARGAHAQLVTTEKDAARLSPAWKREVLVVPVRLVVDDEAEVMKILEQVLSA